VKTIDLASLDLSKENVFEGTRTLDPVGPGVECKPHLRQISAKQILWRLSQKEFEK